MEKAYKNLLTQDMHQIPVNDLIYSLSHTEKAYKNHEFIKTGADTVLGVK